VKWEVYKSYLIACGGIFFVIGVFLSFSIQVAADFLSNWWIEVWTDSLKHKVQTLIFIQPMILTRELFTNLLVSKRYQTESSSSTVMDIATPEEQKDALYYITIFGLISFVELFALLFKYCIQFFGGIRASRIMHTKLSEAVFGSPMRFFETTPVGRIINR
jgi:ABC-type multidrug transport system fused ATPase/permease subunit